MYLTRECGDFNHAVFGRGLQAQVVNGVHVENCLVDSQISVSIYFTQSRQWQQLAVGCGFLRLAGLCSIGAGQGE